MATASQGMSASEAAAALLARYGFRPAGQTRTETVRVGTRRSPILGGTGGEIRTVGGRARLELPGSSVRATVGPRTVNVYRLRPGDRRGPEFLGNFRTKDLQGLETCLQVTVLAWGPAT